MKIVKTALVLVVALMLLLTSTALGCTKQAATLVLAPAEVTAGSKAATHVSGVGLTAGAEIKIMVLDKVAVQERNVECTYLCDPAPKADGRGSFLTKMNLKGFGIGDYTVSLVDKDYETLATATLQVVKP